MPSRSRPAGGLIRDDAGTGSVILENRVFAVRLGGVRDYECGPRYKRVINRFIPSAVLALIVSEVVLIITAYVIGIHFLSEIDPMVWLLFDDGLARILLLVGALVLGIYFQDLYSVIRPPSRPALIQQFCLVFGMGFLFQALLSYGAPTLVLPRRTMMFGSILLIVLLPSWRIIYSSLVLRAIAADRLLFLGASQTACRVAEQIQQKPELGMMPIGFVADPDDGAPPPGAPLLGPLERFREIVAETKPDRVVVGLLNGVGKCPFSSCST